MAVPTGIGRMNETTGRTPSDILISSIYPVKLLSARIVIQRDRSYGVLSSYIPFIESCGEEVNSLYGIIQFVCDGSDGAFTANETFLAMLFRGASA